MKFKESPFSEMLLKFFRIKYCEDIAVMGLVKACAIVSSQVCGGNVGLSVFMVAPTRQFKSRSSIELKEILPKTFWMDLGSDFTMNGLIRKFKGKLPTCCLLINDLTLLCSSKSKRTKDRLLGGIAEVLSEKLYKYDDFKEGSELRGKVTCIANMTSESFEMNKEKFELSTFLERFLTLYYRLDDKTIDDFILQKKSCNGLKFCGKFVKLKKWEIKNLDDFRIRLLVIAKIYACLGLRAVMGVVDQLEALVLAHAYLNKRNYLCDDDIIFVEALKPFINNPFAPNEGKIVEFYKLGMSAKQINDNLGGSESYLQYVYRIIKKVKMRGV